MRGFHQKTSGAKIGLKKNPYFLFYCDGETKSGAGYL